MLVCLLSLLLDGRSIYEFQQTLVIVDFLIWLNLDAHQDEEELLVNWDILLDVAQEGLHGRCWTVYEVVDELHLLNQGLEVGIGILYAGYIATVQVGVIEEGENVIENLLNHQQLIGSDAPLILRKWLIDALELHVEEIMC